MAMKRPYGGEQPCIKIGIFQLRIPFIHATPTIPEAIQAVANGVMAFGAMAAVMQCTGCSEETALAASVLCAMLYMLHRWAGDALVPGWITPAIPLVTAYCLGFPEEQRIQALTALQLVLAIVFLVLGITGMAKKVVAIVPPAIKGGIITGAAISAVRGEFAEGGRFWSQPITIFICLLVMIVVQYSPFFKHMVERGNPVAKFLSKLGLVTPMALAMLLGPLTGEGTFSFSLFPLVSIPNFGLMFRELSPFSVGFPTAMMLIGAIPTAAAIYIVAFGDLLVIQGISNGSKQVRQDEFHSINVNRVNITCGIRNLIMALVSPFAPMCGPLGAPFTISLHENYKSRGQEGMYSIHGGHMSQVLFISLSMFINPLVSLCRPIATATCTLTMVAQGFSCTQIGINTCRNHTTDYAVVGVIAGMMIAQGASMSLLAGIIAYLFVTTMKDRKEDYAYNKELIFAEEEAERKAQLMTEGQTA